MEKEIKGCTPLDGASGACARCGVAAGGLRSSDMFSRVAAKARELGWLWAYEDFTRSWSSIRESDEGLTVGRSTER